MTTHVALLRGINVGGKATVPMKDLTKVCGDLGWQNVVTYQRTGNVLFDASHDAEQLEKSLEKVITKEFSLSIPVVVRSLKQFSIYLTEVPFESEAKSDPNHLVVYFSKSAPSATAVEGLLAKASAGESVMRQSDVVWIHYPNGIGKSKITPAVIDRCLGSPATGRNWNTLTKIHQLLLN